MSQCGLYTNWMYLCHVGYLLLCLIPSHVHSHGYLRYPPSRGSLRDFGYLNEPVNYDVHGQNCGGKDRQWRKNGGKCGVCGDPYYASPRQHEAPDGRYATGTIVGRYTQGRQLQTEVVMTWGHKGWMEFRLCPINNKNRPATPRCLDRYLLRQSGTNRTRFLVEAFGRMDVIPVTLDLPRGLVCRQCVLQWKYRTGKDWGCDGINGCCVGCGPQEEFYGCSDIAIDRAETTTTTTTTSAPRTPSRRSTTTPRRTSTTRRTTRRTAPSRKTTRRKTTLPISPAITWRTTSPAKTTSMRLPISTAAPLSTTKKYIKYAALRACKGRSTNNKFIANWCRGNCPRHYCPRSVCNQACQRLKKW